MVWVVEKKVFYHLIDLGFESVDVPVRVKFEFEVKNGEFVSDTLSMDMLYNKKMLEHRYPNLRVQNLDDAIQKTVQDRIHDYLNDQGYMREDG